MMCSVQLCGFWTLPSSLSPINPDPSLVDLLKRLSSSPLLYVGFGSMETFMLDVNWEILFNILSSGTLDSKIKMLLYSRKYWGFLIWWLQGQTAILPNFPTSGLGKGPQLRTIGYNALAVVCPLKFWPQMEKYIIATTYYPARMRKG